MMTFRVCSVEAQAYSALLQAVSRDMTPLHSGLTAGPDPCVPRLHCALERVGGTRALSPAGARNLEAHLPGDTLLLPRPLLAIQAPLGLWPEGEPL